MANYVSWEELDDAPRSATAPVYAPQPAAVPTQPLTADGLQALGGAPDLVALLRRKEELEAQLKQFGIGQREEAADPRRTKCFPVKVHTKETRIEERRLRLRDEQLAQLNRLEIERARLERVRTEREAEQRCRQLEATRLMCEQAELREEARRSALQALQVQKQKHRQVEQERDYVRQEALRRLACDAQALARRDQRIAEQTRLEAERQALLDRWLRELGQALTRARQERNQERRALLQAEDLRREAALKRAASVRRTRMEQALSETEKRAAESRLRIVRSSGQRADQRSFEAQREKQRSAAHERRRDDEERTRKAKNARGK